MALVLGALIVGSLAITNHSTRVRLQQAATCRHERFEETEQAAADIALSAHISRGDAAETLRGFACAPNGAAPRSRSAPSDPR